jgi:ParB family transcriptional regulator, chromosome partitioning protein
MGRKPENRGLGRGLSALMSDTHLDTASTQPSRADQTIAIEKLFPNPLQPRKDFDPAALKDLADSILIKGVIQPLIVRPGDPSGTYQIVAGERRWRAAQMAQVHALPVIIRDLTDQEVLEIAIIENIQRADLNSLEEALGYKQLMDVFGHTQDMVATALSKSRSHIANLLRLLTLPADVQMMVRSGTLSAGHARALITSHDPVGLAKIVIGKGLSVRETEKLVRQIAPKQHQRGQGRGAVEKDADTITLESDLSASLQMTVSIDHEPGTENGKISIRYNNLSDLDALCQALSVVRRDILAR